MCSSVERGNRIDVIISQQDRIIDQQKETNRLLRQAIRDSDKEVDGPSFSSLEADRAEKILRDRAWGATASVCLDREDVRAVLNVFRGLRKECNV